MSNSDFPCLHSAKRILSESAPNHKLPEEILVLKKRTNASKLRQIRFLGIGSGRLACKPGLLPISQHRYQVHLMFTMECGPGRFSAHAEITQLVE